MRRLLLLCAWLSGCDADLGEVRGAANGDAAAVVGWDDAGAAAPPPADDAAPVVHVDAVDVDGRRALVRGTARDDRAVVGVELHVGHSGPYRVADAGAGFLEWSLSVDVPDGPFDVYAVAYDAGGRAGAHELRVERPVPVDVNPPALRVETPADPHETNARTVRLAGNAADDRGVARVEVEGQVAGALGIARTGDHFGHWSLEAPLAGGADEVYTVRAVDVAGNETRAEVRVRSRAAPEHAPPRLTVVTPVDGETLETTRTPLRVQIESHVAIDAVSWRVGSGPWRVARAEGADFVAELSLAPGAQEIRVVARDVSGLASRVAVRVTVDDGWGDGPRVRLAPPGARGGRVELSLDRVGVGELFPEALRRDTVLLNLDPSAMITSALAGIRDVCGPGWQRPDFVPQCPEGFTTAQRNLWRLLAMTPQTTDVTGTRLEQAAAFTDDSYAHELLPVDFGGLLAEALDRPTDSPVIPDAALVGALVELLVGTHPAAAPGGRIPVTLEDGLTDMATLGVRLGPSGEHPGVVAGPVHATVLTPEFRMRLVLDSNVRLYEGADLRGLRKDYFAQVPDEAPVVGLEFGDRDRFALEGLAPHPTAAMTFGLVESTEPVRPGEQTEPRPRGRSNAWDLDPWMLERVVADASWRAFGERRAGCDLCGSREDGALLYRHPRLGTDLAEITIGTQGYDCGARGRPCTNGVDPTPAGVPEHFDPLPDQPPGWFRIWVPEGLVRTPPAMYVWELILEVAQARLHDGDVPEGEAGATFALEGVDVGLDAASIEAGVRVELQRQRETLAERLLGTFAEGNGRVDVFVDRDAEGTLWLLAAACPAPHEGAECRALVDTGLFADPGARTAVHVDSPWGLRGLPLTTSDSGRVFYVSTREGMRRLEVLGVGADDVALWLRGPREGR